MSTRASGSATPSHTCTILSFEERQKLGHMGGIVESAEDMWHSAEGQELEVANSALSRVQQELEEFKKKIEKSKKKSCPACSVSCWRWRV